MRKFTRMWVSMLVVLAGLLVALPMVAQEASGGAMDNMSSNSDMGKKSKKGRWEGIVTRSDKGKKTLTVRKRSTGLEKDIMYDDSTQWTSQEHGSKKVNSIDPGDVKDNDRIIVVGNYDKKGILHATLISKRLTE